MVMPGVCIEVRGKAESITNRVRGTGRKKKIKQENKVRSTKHQSTSNRVIKKSKSRNNNKIENIKKA